MKEVSVVHFAPDILVARRCLSERVRPCRPLIDCIEGGHSLKEFLDDFPASRRRLQSNAPAGTCRLREQPTGSLNDKHLKYRLGLRLQFLSW